MERTNRTPATDAAALGGSVVAIAMTMFADSGRYEFVGFAVAVTLGALLVGYLRTHERDNWQSLAVGAVGGIIAIPIWGLLAECWRLRLWTDTTELEQWTHEVLHGTSVFSIPLDPPSTVSDEATLVVWIGVTLSVAVLDRILQRRRRRGFAPMPHRRPRRPFRPALSWPLRKRLRRKAEG